MKIAIVVGTRPEIIKMSAIIRQAQDRKLDFCLIHTGQHYSSNMDGIFFKELGLRLPKYNLGTGSGTHAEMTAKMLIGLEKIFLTENPGIVLVQGDTNTVLASALTAAKLHIAIGHVESGLRSFDREMPEEINRMLTDHMSDLLFAPTKETRQNLLREGISPRRIHVTGNTIVDAVKQNLAISEGIQSRGVWSEGKYILATLHRQENVDDEKKLRLLLNGLRIVAEWLGKPVIWPIHPRSRKKLRTSASRLETN